MQNDTATALPPFKSASQLQTEISAAVGFPVLVISEVGKRFVDGVRHIATPAATAVGPVRNRLLRMLAVMPENSHIVDNQSIVFPRTR